MFNAREYGLNTVYVPRVLRNPDPGRESRLICSKRSSREGQLVLALRCLEDSQYYGVAQADLYLRAADASFSMNFIKGYVGIWLQMMLVTSLGRDVQHVP